MPAQTAWGWKGLRIFDFRVAIYDLRPEDVLKVIGSGNSWLLMPLSNHVHSRCDL